MIFSYYQRKSYTYVIYYTYYINYDILYTLYNLYISYAVAQSDTLDFITNYAVQNVKVSEKMTIPVQLSSLRDHIDREKQSYADEIDFHINGDGAMYDRQLMDLGDFSFVNREAWRKYVGDIRFAPCMRQFNGHVCKLPNCSTNVLAKLNLIMAITDGIKETIPLAVPVSGIHDIGVAEEQFQALHTGTGRLAPPPGQGTK